MSACVFDDGEDHEGLEGEVDMLVSDGARWNGV